MRNLIFAECECNEDGVTESICDSKTGTCACKAGWHGYKCQQGKLEPATNRMNIRYLNPHQSVIIKIILFFSPCFMQIKVRNLVFAECECSREGVLCDKTTGACSCKAGWFGELCQGKPKQ